eukprot:g28384.t1
MAKEMQSTERAVLERGNSRFHFVHINIMFTWQKRCKVPSGPFWSVVMVDFISFISILCLHGERDAKYRAGRFEAW